MTLQPSNGSLLITFPNFTQSPWMSYHASGFAFGEGIPEAKEAKAVVVLDAMEGHPFRVALAFASGDMKLHECLGSESAAVFVW